MEESNKPQPQMPSAIEMAFSLNETVVNMLKYAVEQGAVLAPEHIVKDRWMCCINCEFFVQQVEGSIIPYRCSKCGCGMKVKTRLIAAKCPLNKWKA